MTEAQFALSTPTPAAAAAATPANSARYVPAATPIGVPIRIAPRLMMRLPNSAFAMPPSEPGGGVIW